MDTNLSQLSKNVLALQTNAVGAVKETYGSVVAGVGNVIPNTVEVTRPKVNDIASDEAFEEYKRYNAQTALKADERRMWTGMVDRFTSLIMFGAAAGLGVSAYAGGAFGAVGILLAAAAVSVVSYYVLQHPAIQSQNNKTMDVNDYQIKREAALIAREIKAEFSKDQQPFAAGISEKPDNKVAAATAAIQDEPAQGKKRSWQQVIAEKESAGALQIS